MNKKENIDRGEFFKFQATVTRRNGKFYLVTWQGVRGLEGSGNTNRLKDNNENLFKIKDQIISNFKISFEIYFEDKIFKIRANEQIEKTTNKTLNQKNLLNDSDWYEASIIRKKADLEKLLKEVELIKLELGQN